MERYIYHPISRIRHSTMAVFVGRKQQYRDRRRIERLDPIVRSALVHTIQEELSPATTTTNGNDDDVEDAVTSSNNNNNNNSNSMNQEELSIVLQELDEEIVQLQNQLQDADRKEQFIGVRLYKYQKLLTQLQQQQQQQQQQTKENHHNKNIPLSHSPEVKHDIETGGVDECKDQYCTTTTATTSDRITTMDESIKVDIPSTTTADATTMTAPTSSCSTTSSSELEKDETDTTDTDRSNQQQMLYIQQLQTTLHQVQETHKSILISCENIRRKLQQVQKKRTTIQQLMKECHQFVQLAKTTTTTSTTETDVSIVTEVSTVPTTA